jgi:SAM-dependent MidA family methyltransferase
MALELDPGRTAIGNPRLVDAIVAEMAGGAIPFQRFMELALYHPEHGYYARPGRIGGAQGDFLTSPAIHPMFGWTVAAWCRQVWERLGRPAPFAIIEAGAGEGRLASAIMDWAEGRGDGFDEALRYVAVEAFAAGTEPRVEWRRPPVEPVDAGVVVSNELFDALPVRLFEASPRGPVELYVAWDGERFVEVGGPVATIDDAPAEGRFEVSPRAYPLMRDLCSLIERGAVLTFDYGYEQEDLWAPWRRAGTLLCFYRHTAHENPYIHVGEQDITAHVNFSELRVAAEDAGMEVAGPVSQAAFLQGCGAPALVEPVRGDIAEYFTRRRALEQLTDPGGLGRIRVLSASRGLEGPMPGFEEVDE